MVPNARSHDDIPGKVIKHLKMVLPPYLVPLCQSSDVNYSTVYVEDHPQRLQVPEAEKKNSCIAVPLLKRPGWFSMVPYSHLSKIWSMSGKLSPEEHDEFVLSLSSPKPIYLFPVGGDVRVRLVDKIGGGKTSCNVSGVKMGFGQEAGHVHLGPGVMLSQWNFCAETHPFALSMPEVDLAEKAFGEGYSSRFICKTVGGNVYLGTRPESTRAAPNPLQGPGKAHAMQYSRKYYDARFQPQAERLLHRLVAETVNHSRFCDPVSFFLCREIDFSQDLLLRNKLMIATKGEVGKAFGFANSGHLDSDGGYDDDELTKLELQELDEKGVFDDLFNGYESDILQRKDYAERWLALGSGAPTTCGYQFVWNDKNAFSNYEVYQYFLMNGLGLCYRVRSFSTHLMYAHQFYHQTALCLVVCNGKVLSKNDGRLNVFAWGNGGKRKRKNKKTKNKKSSRNGGKRKRKNKKTPRK